MANDNTTNVDKAKSVATTAEKVAAYGPVLGQILSTLGRKKANAYPYILDWEYLFWYLGLLPMY
jgi:hypothetical protein